MIEFSGRVLVVDDRLEWLLRCADLMSQQGYDVTTCRDPLQAVGAFRTARPDVVLLDVRMPGKDGLEVLKEIRLADPWVVVIMLSGYGDYETVVRATKMGADYFIDKNTDIGKIPLVVEKELRSKRLEIDNIRLKADQGNRVVLVRDIVGNCPEMLEVKDLISTYADSDKEVLLTGPTGVGKDFAAMALHYESRRRNEPFKNLRCPQLAPSLVETAIFGHERGAFTDAHRRKAGIIEAAGKGTVLLNEFVEIPVDIQIKFLGVLEYGIYSTVGGEGKDRLTHARFLAATNVDINTAVAEKRLREDLLYRLKKIWIRIPPLKDRGEDILLLADHFIADESKKLDKPPFKLDGRAQDILMNHDWPGNVRELEGLIRPMVQSGRQEITAPLGPGDNGADGGGTMTLKVRMKRWMEDKERIEIERVLKHCKGSRKQAARHLGISYRSLLYKMKKYDLRDKF